MLDGQTAAPLSPNSDQESTRASEPGSSSAATGTWQVASIIVEDSSVADTGQMSRGRFLDLLEPRLRATAAEELRDTIWNGENCPWIDHYVDVYRSRPLSSWQRLIDLWSVRPAGSTVEDLIEALNGRVRLGLREWKAGRQPMSPQFPAEIGPVPDVVFRKRQPGAGPVDPAAAGAISQLGPGRPLPAGLAARYAPEMGATVGAVKVHDDPASGQVAQALQAKAFAVGNHIAFADGEFTPNTPEGDALIAHELAHATTVGADTDTGRAEHDADVMAERSVLRLWGGGNGSNESVGSSQTTGRRGHPRTLELRRCGGEPDSSVDVDEDQGPEILSAEETRRHGFSLSTPGGHPTKGRSYKMGLGAPRQVKAPNSSDAYVMTKWWVLKPGETEHRRRGCGYDFALSLDAVGEWGIVVDIPIGSRTRGRFHHTITVVEPGEAAREEVGGIASTDLTGFLTGLEYHQLQNKRLGMRHQSTQPVHIVLTGGSNPTRPHTNYPNIPSNRYAIRTPSTVTADRHRWVAVPEDISGYARQGRFGQSRRTVERYDGFDLGTGTSASWPISHEVGVVNIHCFVYDISGVVIGHARYRQVILSRSERETVRRFDEYLSQVREQISELDERNAIHVPAVHIATESGQSAEVSLFMGNKRGGGEFTIIDVTPGVKRRTFAGTDFDAALDDFNQGNSYPDGIVRIRVPANNLGVAQNDWTVTSTGESVAQRLSSWSGWASLGLAGLGALSMVIPGAQPLAPVFFIASASTGVVSAGASLYQRSTEARPSELEVAVDIAALAGSLLGLAGAANLLRHGPRIAALSRTGRFVLYAGFTSDTIGGVLMSAHSAGQIADILDGNLSAGEKATAIVQILGGMLLNGALLAWGAKDLGAAKREVAAIVGPDVVERIPNPDLHAISILDRTAMRRLVDADEHEIASIANLIREDPIRAQTLADRYGEQFVVAARSAPDSLEELAQALQIGRPELAGTRGSYGPLPPSGSTTPRPTYGRGPRLSPNDIWRKIRAQFVNSQQRSLAHGAKLQVVGSPVSGSPHTRFELVVPADGTHPAMTIPVRIESTASLPTSVHGSESGPVGMSIRREAPAAPGGDPTYRGSIDIHEELGKADIANALGHELDELIFIARGGHQGGAITAQKRASLLKPHTAAGGAAPVFTAHDRAAARELAEASPPVSGRPAHHGMPPDVVSRSLEMGFGNTAFLEAKLDLLRASGVDEDMIGRLRTLAHGGAVQAGTQSMPNIASPRIIGHLVNGDGFSAGNTSPIAGLHLESRLQTYSAGAVADNSPIHLVPAGDSPHASGLHSYEQWVWTAGGAPTGPRPTTPANVAGSKVGGWELAVEPKTTFDDLPSFLVKADTAFAEWFKANPTTAGSNLNWSHTLPSGETIVGWVNINAGTGAVTHRTVYPYKTGGLTGW